MSGAVNCPEEEDRTILSLDMSSMAAILSIGRTTGTLPNNLSVALFRIRFWTRVPLGLYGAGSGFILAMWLQIRVQLSICGAGSAFNLAYMAPDPGSTLAYVAPDPGSTWSV